MLNSVRNKNGNCEHEARFIQDRITSVDKIMSEFVLYFSQYSRKAARLRDKSDEIARVTQVYAEQELINKSLSNSLANFANCMSKVADFGDMRVMNIDNKVVNEFAHYEGICKRAKDEVKQIYAARDRELTRKKQLERVREKNPRNRQEIMQAESDVIKATAEVSRSIHNLEEQTTAFERQKLHDIKSIFLDFITTEIGYHAKLIEVMTDAYQEIDAINENTDLQDFHIVRQQYESDFKKSLRMPELMGLQKSNTSIGFRTAQSLGSLSNLFSATKKRDVGIPQPKPRSFKKSISKSAETLDSMKRSISETETSTGDEDEDESAADSGEEKSNSSFVIEKYQN